MSRPLRVVYPNAIYHVMTRGVERRAIYSSIDDRHAFLGVLQRIVLRYGWICHAYCLMDNHYHLVVQTPHANLPAGMQQLNGQYAQRFNRAYGRAGHLFERRYHDVLVESDEQLMTVCRYVVLNPVRARLCAEAGEWRWSSYRATVGDAPAPVFLSVVTLLSLLGGEREVARTAFRRLVGDGADRTRVLAAA